jgi:hypothetical protein
VFVKYQLEKLNKERENSQEIERRKKKLQIALVDGS